MKISVAVVMSLDAKLTRHDGPNVQAWAAPEEQARFHALLESHDCEVLGSGTYKVIRNSLQLNADRLRIVLTKDAEKYASESVPGKLEFSTETSSELVARLEIEGYKKLLIVGGPRMISDFLSLGVVSKLYVTLEPRLFGQGKPLVTELPVDIQLQLVRHEQLNPQGTLLLTYMLV